jgi:hypothetical protein
MSGAESDRKKPPRSARERPANPGNLAAAEAVFDPTPPKKSSKEGHLHQPVKVSAKKTSVASMPAKKNVNRKEAT